MVTHSQWTWLIYSWVHCLEQWNRTNDESLLKGSQQEVAGQTINPWCTQQTRLCFDQLFGWRLVKYSKLWRQLAMGETRTFSLLQVDWTLDIYCYWSFKEKATWSNTKANCKPSYHCFLKLCVSSSLLLSVVCLWPLAKIIATYKHRAHAQNEQLEHPSDSDQSPVDFGEFHLSCPWVAGFPQCGELWHGSTLWLDSSSADGSQWFPAGISASSHAKLVRWQQWVTIGNHQLGTSWVLHCELPVSWVIRIISTSWNANHS